MKKLVLASKSPRRKQILSNSGLEFTIIPSNYDEKMPGGEFKPEMISELAFRKAEETALRCDKNSVILGADTVVVHKNHVLGKPKTKQDAYNMLKELSGDTHYVVTGVCLIDNSNNNIYKTYVITYVTFNYLSDEMINYYIENFNPMDKAGAYGIQELPEGFVKTVNGEFDNVIGLPAKEVIKLLNNTGITTISR